MSVYNKIMKVRRTTNYNIEVIEIDSDCIHTII